MKTIFLARPLKRKLINIKQMWQFRFHISDIRQQLDEILSQHSNIRPVIIFMPGLSWNRQLVQRPQHLAKALAAHGALVFYMEPKFQSGYKPCTEINPNLFWCNFPVQLFKHVFSPWVYMLTWSLDYTDCLNQPRIIYDIVDDLSVFNGESEEIRINHETRLQCAKLVLVSAKRLISLTKGYSDKILYCPNAVDYDFFNKAPLETPFEIREFSGDNRPKVGYCGAIASWLDFNLLKNVAEFRPAYDFIIVGPDTNHLLEKSSLLDEPNIYWIGKQPYEKIPAYISAFDVAIIPFQLNSITHSTSPLKLFEYFAAGKPVVITPMDESQQYPGVLVAETPYEFAQQLDNAIQYAKDPEYQKIVKGTAKQNTWEMRAQQIMSKLDHENSYQVY